jgi:hypothetical protein
MEDIKITKCGDTEIWETSKTKAVYKNDRGVMRLWNPETEKFACPPTDESDYDSDETESCTTEDEPPPPPPPPPPKHPRLQKTHRGVPIDASWRRRPDGTYNHKPLDPDYHKNYMKNYKAEKVKCAICQNELFNRNLHRHQKTSKTCLKIRAVIEQQQKT